MVPDIARKLVAQGHEVVLEPGAGEHAGIPDGLFGQAGATLGSDSWAADVVVKVAPRSLHSVFLGGFGAAAGTVAEAEDGVDRTVRSTSAADVAIQLSYARLVVVVPGYGMAVAQAQRAVDRAGSRRRAQAHDGLVLRGHRQPALLRPEDDDAVR